MSKPIHKLNLVHTMMNPICFHAIRVKVHAELFEIVSNIPKHVVNINAHASPTIVILVCRLM